MKKTICKIVILDAVISFLPYFLCIDHPEYISKPRFQCKSMVRCRYFTTLYVYSVRRRTVVFTDYFIANTNMTQRTC